MEPHMPKTALKRIPLDVLRADENQGNRTFMS